MKHFKLFLIFIFFGSNLNSQSIVFQEDFEGTTYKVSSYSTGNTGWGISYLYPNSGLKADSVSDSPGDTIYLITDAFSTLSNKFIAFKFSHIAKIGGYAEIEVSNDNGISWNTLEASEYYGKSQFPYNGNKFLAISYANEWDPSNPLSMNVDFYRDEYFDISKYAANSTNVKIRFKLTSPLQIDSTFYGWMLDDIIVKASADELIPPLISVLSPIVEGEVTNKGPYEVKAKINDASGIDTAMIVYTIFPGNKSDTIGMAVVAQDTFLASIPFPGYGYNINYHVVAIDNGANSNKNISYDYSIFCTYSPYSVGQIGEDFQTVNYPFLTVFEDAKTQLLYTASELKDAGVQKGEVNRIALDIASVSNVLMKNFSIKMQNTKHDSLVDFISNGFTTVYYSDYLVQNKGWNIFDLSYPFFWNGTDNLLIEICFDNSSFGFSSMVNSSYTDKATACRVGYNNSIGCSIRRGGVASNLRPNLIIEVDNLEKLKNDVGVNSIVNPLGGVPEGNNFNIEVNIKNFGIDTVNNLVVNWTYDGQAQNPKTITAKLNPGEVSLDVNLGNKIATSGSHRIVAWTENPNGQPDQNLGNDVADFDFYACNSSLSGNYTIGGVNPDFVSFKDASLALSQCGISGPVTFNIRDGLYIGQIEIATINGASMVNNVVFKSESEDSTAVVLTHDASNDKDNYVVKIDGASYVSFKQIGFVAMDSVYSNVIVFDNIPGDISLLNCEIKNAYSIFDSDNKMNLIHSMSEIDNNIVIQNCRLSKGNIAIALMGKSAHSSGWEIFNNVIEGQFTGGVFLRNAKSGEIESNTIIADTTIYVNDYKAIFLLDNSGSAFISKNTISVPVSKTSLGIVVKESLFSVYEPALIVNNFISLSQSPLGYNHGAGIEIHSQNINVYHNNVNIYGNQYNSAALRIDEEAPFSENISLGNNNFVNMANSYSVDLNGILDSKIKNYNNNLYSSNNAMLAKWWDTQIGNIEMWRKYSNGALGSINYDPQYISNTDLHVKNNMLNKAAYPISTIVEDIDGDIRDANMPDIGADEFVADLYDLAAIEIVNPISDCSLSNKENITLKIRNVGETNATGDIVASFQIGENTQVVRENMDTTIIAGGEIEYTFYSTIDLDMSVFKKDSLFDIKASVDYIYDSNRENDSLKKMVFSGFTTPSPIVNDKVIDYGSSDTLKALSKYTLRWYQDKNKEVELAYDSIYITPHLYSSTDYYVAASNGVYEEDIKIGDGKEVDVTSPIDLRAEYSWSRIIYNATDMQVKGNTNQIEKISFYVDNFIEPVYLANQKIYLAHTADLTHQSNEYVNPKNMTMVFDGRLMISGKGWLTIEFQKPFIYNGSDNIVLQWENHSGISMQNGLPLWKSTEAIHKNLYNSSNQRFTFLDGTLSVFSPDIKFHFRKSACESDLSRINVFVVNRAQYDVGVSEIITPKGNLQVGSEVNVSVMVKNYGRVTANNIPINYSVDGQILIHDTVVVQGAGLLPDSTELHLFDDKLKVPGEYFRLCSSTSLNTDTFWQNDTYCNYFNVTPADVDVAVNDIKVFPNSNDTVNTNVKTSVFIYIQNKGLNTIYSLPVNYSIGNTVVAQELWTGFLLPNDTIIYRFVETFTSGLGEYEICGMTNHPGDLNPVNDKSCRRLYGKPVGVKNIINNEFYVQQNYPNPANGNTIIEYYLPYKEKIKFEFKNILGQQIIKSEIDAFSGKNNISLNTKELESGIYFYSIYFSNRVITKKMVVN